MSRQIRPNEGADKEPMPQNLTSDEVGLLEDVAEGSWEDAQQNWALQEESNLDLGEFQ